MSWTRRRRRSASGDIVCRWGTEEDGELLAQGTLLGSWAGDLSAEGLELLSEGLEGC